MVVFLVQNAKPLFSYHTKAHFHYCISVCVWGSMTLVLNGAKGVCRAECKIRVPSLLAKYTRDEEAMVVSNSQGFKFYTLSLMVLVNYKESIICLYVSVHTHLIPHPHLNTHTLLHPQLTRSRKISIVHKGMRKRNQSIKTLGVRPSPLRG